MSPAVSYVTNISGLFLRIQNSVTHPKPLDIPWCESGFGILLMKSLVVRLSSQVISELECAWILLSSKESWFSLCHNIIPCIWPEILMQLIFDLFFSVILIRHEHKAVSILPTFCSDLSLLSLFWMFASVGSVVLKTDLLVSTSTSEILTDVVPRSTPKHNLFGVDIIPYSCISTFTNECLNLSEIDYPNIMQM